MGGPPLGRPFSLTVELWRAWAASGRIVEDHAKGMAPARAELADAVVQLHLVVAAHALHRPSVGFIEAPQIGLDLPLDIRGTAFQQRVWQALSDIPPGATASYAAIPCHRVVRNDGALSGYAWGVDRKRTLIEREAAA